MPLYRLSELPPSVNGMYANNFKKGRKGRHKTAEYTAWLELAMIELKTVTPMPEAPYELHLHCPHNMRGDLDGRAKGLIDALVKSGATPDDKHLARLVMTKKSDNGVIIEVMPFPRGEVDGTIRVEEEPPCKGL